MRFIMRCLSVPFWLLISLYSLRRKGGGETLNVSCRVYTDRIRVCSSYQTYLY